MIEGREKGVDGCYLMTFHTEGLRPEVPCPIATLTDSYPLHTNYTLQNGTLFTSMGQKIVRCSYNFQFVLSVPRIKITASSASVQGMK